MNKDLKILAAGAAIAAGLAAAPALYAQDYLRFRMTRWWARAA